MQRASRMPSHAARTVLPALVTGRIPSIQIVRALAALSVAFGHSLHEAASFHRMDAPSRLVDQRFWTGGVDLFFVLSGFIMMWTFGARFGESGSGVEFLRRRLVRIAPLYWGFTIALALAALVFPTRLESTVLKLDHLVLSMLFVPHIAPSGGISPLLALGWTLVYEIFFYLAFASALVFRRNVGLSALVAIFLVAHCLARYTLLLPEALQLFWGDTVMFEFFLGVGFYFVQKDGGVPGMRLLSMLLAVLVVAVLATAGGLGGSRFFDLGLPALVALAVLFHLLNRVTSRFWLALVLVGEASYAIYLSHPFVLEFVKLCVERLPLSPQGHVVVYLASAVSVVIIAGLAIHLLVERRIVGGLGSLMGHRQPA